MFTMEVVAGVLRPPCAGPGVTAAVGYDDVPVAGQGVVRAAAVESPLPHQHLLGGGGAEPALHLPVTVSVTASQAVLVTVTQVAALQVDVDPAQLCVLNFIKYFHSVKYIERLFVS